jgi:hypothetical protein
MVRDFAVRPDGSKKNLAAIALARGMLENSPLGLVLRLRLRAEQVRHRHRLTWFRHTPHEVLKTLGEQVVP